MKTNTLVKVIEKLSIRIPYTSHRNAPVAAIRNMAKETSFVDFDFHVFITCGKNIVQDNIPAVIPITSTFITLLGINNFKNVMQKYSI